jgi:hypothetical protein
MTHHRLSLPVSVVKQYTLDVIRRNLPPIQLQIAGQHTTPFPEHRSRLKSFYEYRPRSLSRVTVQGVGAVGSRDGAGRPQLAASQASVR